MTDIVARLRRIGEKVLIPCPDNIRGCLIAHYRIETNPVCAEAADEIERLRREAHEWAEAVAQAAKGSLALTQEIERLRAALQEIIAQEEQFNIHWAADVARAALGEKKDG